MVAEWIRQLAKGIDLNVNPETNLDLVSHTC